MPAEMPGPAYPKGVATEQVPAALPGERHLEQLDDELDALDDGRLVGSSALERGEEGEATVAYLRTERHG